VRQEGIGGVVNGSRFKVNVSLQIVLHYTTSLTRAPFSIFVSCDDVGGSEVECGWVADGESSGTVREHGCDEV
jgi:hypothetical protein